MVRSHGVRLAAASAALCALAACQSTEGAPSADPSKASGSTTGSASASASPATSAGTDPTASPSVLVADPQHAVATPGPRSGPLVPVDLLVLSQDTIPDDVVKRIQQTEGVTRVEQISMATPSVEDRLIKVVAVDAATYRNFTPMSSADNQALWDRVAGGEVAVDWSLQKALVPDAKGYLKLGASADAPEIHVGAWAQQIPGTVDAVVNEKWGKALGMKTGNALLVTTTITSPDRVAKPLQEIVGPGVSVQRLDIAAKLGLDPGAVQIPVVSGALAQAVGNYTYTATAGGRVTPSAAWVRSHIVTETVPILGRVTCNKYLIPQLEAALRDVLAQGLADKIHPGEYAGCYYPRFIAGTHSLSNHAFGLALDLNVPGNQRGTAGQMDRGVVQIFERWGFTWGGTWHYTDPMHFEMNRIVHPG